MSVLVIIFATVITGGNVGTFIDMPSIYPSSVDSEDTPGSEEWFEQTDTVLVPKDWVVLRNGVVTNVPPPQIYPPDETSNEESNKYWRIAATGLAPGDEYDEDYGDTWTRWRPGSFDISWKAFRQISEYEFEEGISYYAYATNFETRALTRHHARPIKSINRYSTAILSLPFEAYYERLYHASKSDQMLFDTDKWGPREPGSDFWFNIAATNVYGNPLEINAYLDFIQGGSTGRNVKATRRFISDTARNLQNLKKRLNAMMQDSTATYNNPGFIYRPGWILDGMGVLTGDNKRTRDPYAGYYDPTASLNWWASRDVRLNVLDSLIPQFDWTEGPCDEVKNQALANSWVSNCVTLARLSSGPYNFFTMGGINPLTYIVRDVNFGDITGYETLLNGGENGNMGFSLECALTNIFPHSAEVELERDPGRHFKMAYDSTSPLHRLNSRYFIGVNQILSCMDRTIHIPVVNYTFYYNKVAAYKSAKYSSQINVVIDGSTGSIRIKEGEDPSWSLVSTTNSTVVAYGGAGSRLHAIVDKPTTVKQGHGILNYDYIIAVDESEVLNAAVLLGNDGVDCNISVTGLEDAGNGRYYIYFTDYEHSNTCATVHSIFTEDVELTIPVTYSASCSYSYETMASNKVEVGQIHGIDKRIDGRNYGIMYGVMTCEGENYKQYLSNTMTFPSKAKAQYKTTRGSYGNKSDLTSKIKTAISEIVTKIQSIFSQKYGYDYTNVSSAMSVVAAPNADGNQCSYTPSFTYEVIQDQAAINSSHWHVSANKTIITDDTYPSSHLPYEIGYCGISVQVSISSQDDNRKAFAGYGKKETIISTDWKWDTLQKEEYGK